MEHGSKTVILRSKTEDYASLPPERKIEILAEMGFRAVFETHQPDCPSQYTTGIRCICLPPGTSWWAPRDVKEHLHETYEELCEWKRQRTAEGA